MTPNDAPPAPQPAAAAPAAPAPAAPAPAAPAAPGAAPPPPAKTAKGAKAAAAPGDTLTYENLRDGKVEFDALQWAKKGDRVTLAPSDMQNQFLLQRLAYAEKNGMVKRV